MKTLLRSLLLLLLATAAHAQEAVLTAGVTVTVRLGGVPGDEAQQVSGSYTISSGGTVSLPYLKGSIQAAGLRATELSTRIAAAYKSAQIYANPNIVVLAAGTNVGGDLVVMVGGEVRNPRAVQFRPGIDLYGAITEAGGPSEYGDMKKVKLIRNKQERIIDLRKVNSENSIELMAGDKVVVP